MLGIERLAIVDWDVHHGNGAQAIFADDPSVLTVSSCTRTGAFPPNSGLVEERGYRRRQGQQRQHPMPVGCGDGAYQYAARPSSARHSTRSDPS